MVSQITEVWSHNSDQELMSFDRSLKPNTIVSIDTEFPGHIFTTPKSGNDFIRYEDMKFNINHTKILQLGITLFDPNENTHRSWVFNFHYDLRVEIMKNQDSIQFLRGKGLDFEQLAEQGIRVEEFAKKFARIIVKHRNLKWIAFHGLYDFGYLTRILTNQRPLPNTLNEFLSLGGHMFREVVDLKYMASLCEGLCHGELGLERLAALLGVERVGQAHDAGSDALLVSRAFLKIIGSYGEGPYLSSLGRLYGIDTPI